MGQRSSLPNQNLSMGFCECLQRHSLLTCSSVAALIFCPEDSDELITRAGLPPRERLLLAIEQCCSLDHLEHIVQWHSLDVRSGGNTLLMKAVGSSNGLALTWLVSRPAFSLAGPFVSILLLHRSSKQDYDTSECVKSTKGLRLRDSSGRMPRQQRAEYLSHGHDR